MVFKDIREHRSDTLRKIGVAAKNFRQNILKERGLDISLATGYTMENISAFERGLNNNLLYVVYLTERGFDLDLVINKGYNYEVSE